MVFFTDKNSVGALTQNNTMTVYSPEGQTVKVIDLIGTAKALEYAPDCQDKTL